MHFLLQAPYMNGFQQKQVTVGRNVLVLQARPFLRFVITPSSVHLPEPSATAQECQLHGGPTEKMPVEKLYNGSHAQMRRRPGYFWTPFTGCTAFPWLASTARATTSAKSGKAFFASLENTWTPLISTSKDDLRPTLPTTVAFGIFARICFFRSAKRFWYPHPLQYSTTTLTGFAPAILADPH
uniref:Uncharacterized protein n=1 Tax=Rhipicephalus zambeziensis TaxID=60191 RepID=A0A224YG31_9ACAR